MNWSNINLSVLDGNTTKPVQVRFSDGEVYVIEITLDGGRVVVGNGLDLFDALSAARRELELFGLLIVCNGARRNVFPSPMLRQATAGRRAYVLDIPRTPNRPPVVDIMEGADKRDVCTVDEQLEWYSRWLASSSSEGPVTGD